MCNIEICKSQKVYFLKVLLDCDVVLLPGDIMSGRTTLLNELFCLINKELPSNEYDCNGEIAVIDDFNPADEFVKLNIIHKKDGNNFLIISPVNFEETLSYLKRNNRKVKVYNDIKKAREELLSSYESCDYLMRFEKSKILLNL